MKTVRNSIEHFSFFLLPFSFFFERGKKALSSGMKKEKGRRKKKHPDFTGVLLRTLFDYMNQSLQSVPIGWTKT
jgi:hypothetical protein